MDTVSRVRAQGLAELPSALCRARFGFDLLPFGGPGEKLREAGGGPEKQAIPVAPVTDRMWNGCSPSASVHHRLPR